MGWIDESAWHEGYVAPVFGDGATGNGRSTATGYGVGTGDEIRPAAAVIGWRVTCAHARTTDREDIVGTWSLFKDDQRWFSPTLWRRVYSPDAEDLDQHLVYVPLDSQDVDLDDRQDLEEILIDEWRAHIAPEDHARSIRAALDGVASAKQTLDLEVAAGRTAGLSWAEIGRVAGITRQAARDRWGSP